MLKLIEKYTKKQNKKIDPRWDALKNKRFNINKWLIQKERSQKLEEIKEEHITKQTQTIKVCQETGETHLYHRAYEHEGQLYYKGKLFSDS